MVLSRSYVSCWVCQEYKNITAFSLSHSSGLYSQQAALRNAISATSEGRAGLLLACYKSIARPKLDVPQLQCRPTACATSVWTPLCCPWTHGQGETMQMLMSLLLAVL